MAVYAGQRIRAGDIPYVMARAKAASESVTSSTAMQDDNDLFRALEPGLYRVELILTVTGATGGDIDCTWSSTGTMSAIGRSCMGPTLGTTDIENTSMHVRAYSLTSNVLYGIESDPAVIREDLMIEVTLAGTLQFRFTQDTSSGTATQLSASSRMIVTPLTEF